MHTNRSQAAAILKHLQKGQTITSLQALNLYGCARLGARVHELKRGGHQIASSRVATGNGKHVASYQLIP